MSIRGAKGTPFHAEFSSTDASALTEPNSRLTLYGANSTTAVTLGATDVVVITDLLINTGAAITVQVYDGADNVVGAGELVHKATVNGTTVLAFTAPHFCRAGTWPKVKTSGPGAVDCLIRGNRSRAEVGLSKRGHPLGPVDGIVSARADRGVPK